MMPAPRMVLVWHVEGNDSLVCEDDLARAGLNLAQIVSVEPTHISLRNMDGSGTRHPASRIYVTSQSGVYTHRNDPYEASSRRLPEVEVRGGGPMSYLIPYSLEEAVQRIDAGQGFPLPPSVCSWLEACAVWRIERWKTAPQSQDWVWDEATRTACESRVCLPELKGVFAECGRHMPAAVANKAGGTVDGG